MLTVVAENPPLKTPPLATSVPVPNTVVVTIPPLPTRPEKSQPYEPVIVALLNPD